MFRILDIPWWYYAIAVVIGLVAWKIWKKPVLGLLAGYAFLVLAETVLIREKSTGNHLNLEVFWSWRAWKIQRTQVLTNIVMFIPVGVLSGWMWKWRGLWFAVGLTVVIELLQLMTNRGLCEFDDVIHNCLGAAVGIGIVLLIRVIAEKRRDVVGL